MKKNNQKKQVLQVQLVLPVVPVLVIWSKEKEDGYSESQYL